MRASEKRRRDLAALAEQLRAERKLANWGPVPGQMELFPPDGEQPADPRPDSKQARGAA